jgi:hypothetical protein
MVTIVAVRVTVTIMLPASQCILILGLQSASASLSPSQQLLPFTTVLTGGLDGLRLQIQLAALATVTLAV